MRTSGAIFIVSVALVLGCAHARTLQQGITFNPPIIGTPVSTPSTATGPWANFTREPQTLYVAVKMLNSTTAASDEACANICNGDIQCEYWTWCPTNVTAGCGVPAANATYSSTMPPGGCITSCDDVRNRTALFIAYGKSVPFTAGLFDPNAASGASGSRRLLQAGDSVWTNYTYAEHQFYQGIDALPTTAAQTAEDCARACNADQYCEFWSLCPPAVGTAGCEVPSFTPNASPQAVPAGTCVLSYDGTKDQAAFFVMLGSKVTFEGGRWNASAASNTTGSTPGTSTTTPSISLPTIPGLTTPPATPPGTSTSNSTLPSNATSSLRIYSFWNVDPKQTKCYTWNGTDFEEDSSSSTITSSGTETVPEEEYTAYKTDLCASLDTAGETIAQDLLAGGAAARKAFAVTTMSCPGATDTLFSSLRQVVNPQGNTDVERVAKYAQAWVTAADELGWPACVTLVVLDRGTGKTTEQYIKP